MSRDELALGIAVCSIAPAAFGATLPPAVELRRAPDSPDLRTAQRQGLTLALGMVLGVAYLARSWPVAGIGVASVAAWSTLYGKARCA